MTKPTPKTYDLSDLPTAIAKNIGIDPTTGHWIWTGNYHPDGLPLIGSVMAHSAIYRLLNPELADHTGRIFRTCGEKKCVNPAHMRFPQVENGGVGRKFLEEKKKGVEKVQSVEMDTPNNSDLVKVLQRIADVLERIGNKTM